MIDTQAPAGPTIDPSDGTQIGGTAEPGTTVELDLDGDGDTDVSVPVDDDGNWTYTPDAPLPPGTIVTGVVVDDAGNESEPEDETVSTPGNPVNEPPVVSIAIPDQQSPEDTPFSFAIPPGSFTDPDSPALTYSATLANDDPLPAWLTFNAATGTFSGTPPLNYNGSIAIDVTVSDGIASVTDTFTLTITAVNDAPDARNDAAATGEDTPLVRTAANGLLANDSDVDGDTLTATAGTFTTTQGGSIVINANGSYTYTPDEGFVGTDTFTYTVSDGTLTDTAVLTITVSEGSGPVNAPPIAVGDTVTTAEDTSVTVAVLANDLDPDGDPLTVTGATASNGTVTVNPNGTLTYVPAANFNGTATITYTVSDGEGGSDTGSLTVTVTPVNDAPVGRNDAAATGEDTPLVRFAANGLLANDSDVDGDNLTVTAGTFDTAQGGTITVSANGAYTYTPDDGFVGTDTFTYTVSDGNLTDTAVLTITVSEGGGAVNAPPIAIGDAVTTAEDTSVTVAVLANDLDPDGDSLSVTGATASSGTVTVNPNGTLTYVPAANFNGTATVTYTVSDGQGGSDSGSLTVTVTPVNDAPVGANDAAATTEDTPLVRTAANGVLANDSDVDGDNLTITAGTFATSQGGSITISANGAYTYTPAAGFVGTDTFTYTVSDGAASDTATLTITVAEGPGGGGDAGPATIGGDTNGSGDEDTQITGTLTASDPDGLEDGSYFTVTSDPSNGTAAIDPESGEWIYTPDANYNGADAFTVTVTDDEGFTTTQVIAITVEPVDDPAVIGGDISGSGDGESPIEGTLTATDVDGLEDGTYFSVTDDPESGSATIDPESGEWVYTPDDGFSGSDSFTVTVTDDDGGTTNQVLTISVTAPDTIDAVDDVAVLETGGQVTVPGQVQSDTDLDVVSLAESTYGADNSLLVTIPADYAGELRVTVSQTALVAVADAFRLDIYTMSGTRVFSANTPDSLVGDVAGLPVLGVLDDDTLVATIEGLPAGQYRLVVRNSQSSITDLLDTDGNGISLEELDGTGLVLGADNEDIILDAVEDALNDPLLGLNLNIGTVVRGLVDPLLNPLYGLPVSEAAEAIANVLNNPLINLSAFTDEVLDEVAEALLSNTLTVFQKTSISAQFTEFDFVDEDVSGNVITGDGGAGADELSNDGGAVVQIAGSGGDTSAVAAGGSATVEGLYGVLTIASNGSYTYTAYGSPASVGQSDVFTYTLSDGTLSDTATLTIEIEGSAPAAALASFARVSSEAWALDDWNADDAVYAEPRGLMVSDAYDPFATVVSAGLVVDSGAMSIA